MNVNKHVSWTDRKVEMRSRQVTLRAKFQSRQVAANKILSHPTLQAQKDWARALLVQICIDLSPGQYILNIISLK